MAPHAASNGIHPWRNSALTFQEFAGAVEGTLKSAAPFVPGARPFERLPDHIEWIGENVTVRLGEHGPNEVALYLVAEGVSAQPGIYPRTLRDVRDVANGIAALFDVPDDSDASM